MPVEQSGLGEHERAAARSSDDRRDGAAAQDVDENPYVAPGEGALERRGAGAGAEAGNDQDVGVPAAAVIDAAAHRQGQAVAGHHVVRDPEDFDLDARNLSVEGLAERLGGLKDIHQGGQPRSKAAGDRHDGDAHVGNCSDSVAITAY